MPTSTSAQPSFATATQTPHTPFPAQTAVPPAEKVDSLFIQLTDPLGEPQFYYVDVPGPGTAVRLNSPCKPTPASRWKLRKMNCSPLITAVKARSTWKPTTCAQRPPDKLQGPQSFSNLAQTRRTSGSLWTVAWCVWPPVINPTCALRQTITTAYRPADPATSEETSPWKVVSPSAQNFPVGPSEFSTIDYGYSGPLVSEPADAGIHMF